MRSSIRSRTAAVILLTLGCNVLSGAAAVQHVPEALAKHGMVSATTGAQAVDAGVEVLKRGGTAADAAMATALTQVCLAAGSYVSYAGLLSMVYFDARSHKIFDLNAGFNTVRGETEPLTIPGVGAADLAGKGFAGFTSQPSGRTALVPGFLAGVEAAHKRFGRLPFAQIVAPAIRCAEDGFEWTAPFAGMVASRQAVLARLPATKSIFLKEDGSPYKVGERFKQPVLARTLRRIAASGVHDYMYTGTWARELVAAVQHDGGRMTLEDLAAYRARWTEPVRGSYRGYDIYSHGLPATGGVSLIEALHLADVALVADGPAYWQSPLSLYWLTQIAKVGPILGAPGVAGPMSQALGIDLSATSRTERRTAQQLWAVMQTGRFPTVPLPKSGAPTHSDGIVVVDRWGSIAAVTHSIESVNWGSTGIFVSGISIPDAASFQQAAIAALPPGSRLPDPTNPGLALKGGKPFLGFSAIGSGIHLRTIAALVEVLGYGKTPQEAINAPSLGSFDFSAASSGRLVLTVGSKEFTAEFLQTLRELGQEVREDDSMRGYWIAVSIDPRRHQLRGGALREFKMGGRASGY